MYSERHVVSLKHFDATKGRTQHLEPFIVPDLSLQISTWQVWHHSTTNSNQNAWVVWWHSRRVWGFLLLSTTIASNGGDINEMCKGELGEALA